MRDWPVPARVIGLYPAIPQGGKMLSHTISIGASPLTPPPFSVPPLCAFLECRFEAYPRSLRLRERAYQRARLATLSEPFTRRSQSRSDCANRNVWPTT